MTAASCLASADTTFTCTASWNGSSKSRQRGNAPCAVRNSSGRTRRMRRLSLRDGPPTERHWCLAGVWRIDLLRYPKLMGLKRHGFRPILKCMEFGVSSPARLSLLEAYLRMRKRRRSTR